MSDAVIKGFIWGCNTILALLLLHSLWQFTGAVQQLPQAWPQVIGWGIMARFLIFTLTKG